MTLAGTWQNEYGSRMSLSVENGAVSGTYDSTTGATGRYLVTGWESEAGRAGDLGCPVALVISWHSIADLAPDPGWHWVSALSGQVHTVGGEELLIVTHLLVASVAFEGLCRRGIYSDKLTFRRLKTKSDHLPVPLHATDKLNGPVSGSWTAQDGTIIDVQVVAEIGSGPALVAGALVQGDDRLDILGFTDIRADAHGIGFQSMAIAAADKTRQNILAAGGWFEAATGTVTLQSLTSLATKADQLWLQTDLRPLFFSRPPPINAPPRQ